MFRRVVPWSTPLLPRPTKRAGSTFLPEVLSSVEDYSRSWLCSASFLRAEHIWGSQFRRTKPTLAAQGACPSSSALASRNARGVFNEVERSDECQFGVSASAARRDRGVV